MTKPPCINKPRNRPANKTAERIRADYERLWSGDSSGSSGGPAAAELAPYYLWAQTADCVHLAVYDPTAGPGRPPVIQLTPGGICIGAAADDDESSALLNNRAGIISTLKLQQKTNQQHSQHNHDQHHPQQQPSSHPVVSRRWAHPIDQAAGAVSWVGGGGGGSGDSGGRVAMVRVVKARRGQVWTALFQVGLRFFVIALIASRPTAMTDDSSTADAPNNTVPSCHPRSLAG